MDLSESAGSSVFLEATLISHPLGISLVGVERGAAEHLNRGVCSCFTLFFSISQVYYFSKGHLKTANKQYTTVKNDYEITFSNETSVVACDEAQHLPSVKFDFVPIGDLESADRDALVGEAGSGGIACMFSKMFLGTTTVITIQPCEDINNNNSNTTAKWFTKLQSNHQYYLVKKKMAIAKTLSE